MIHRRLLLATALATALVLPAARAADGQDHTPLGEQMEVIGDAFRQLRRQVADPAQQASTLELITAMQAAARKGLELKPEYTAEQPAGEQATFVEAYRRDMQAFIAQLEETAAAVKAGDHPRAGELVAKMRDHQRTSHQAYRRPKD